MSRALHALERASRLALLVTAGDAALRFGRIAGGRIVHPFELEWLEGDLFHHALRIRDGLAWYPAPSLEFLPALYPPGFQVLAALLALPFGESLAVPRAISLASTLLAASLIALAVRRASGDLGAGLVAAGFFLALFELCGAWYDVGRLDMLALALALLGVHLCERGASLGAFSAGLAALLLSALVKQSQLAFLAGTLAVWLAWDARRALLGLAVCAALLGAACAGLELSSGGWFSFYAFEVPRGLLADRTRLFGFFTRWLPALAGPAALAMALAVRRGGRAPLRLLLLPVAAGVSLSGLGLTGGYANHLIPTAAWLSLLLGLGLARLRALATDARVAARAAALAIELLVLLQFARLRFDPAPHLPGAAETAAGWRAVERVRALPEPVLAPYHPWLLHLAGRPMHLHFHALNELQQGIARGLPLDDGGLAREIESGLVAGCWAAWIGSETPAGEVDTWVERAARGHYAAAGRLLEPGDGGSLYPLTGNRIRPGLVHRPVRAPAAGARSECP